MATETQTYQIGSDISDMASEGGSAAIPAGQDDDWNFQPDRMADADVSLTETYGTDISTATVDGMLDHLDASSQHRIQSLLLNVDITDIYSPPRVAEICKRFG